MGDERLGWIDAARVLAIVLIVGFHAAYEINADSSLRPAGFLGASLFFIISGFLLASKYPGLSGGKEWLRWLKHRYARVASVYYPALGAIVLLFGAQTYYRGPYDLGLHMLFLQWTGPSTEFSIIASAWFLTPLLALYAVYPWLNGWIRNRPVIAIAGMVGAGAYRLWIGDWVSVSPIFFLGDFLFGMMMAYGKREALAGLLVSLLKPIMIVPYGVFWATLAGRRWLDGLGGRVRPIAAHTMEIFLFHEAFIMVFLGKWNVAGMGRVGSIVITVGAVVATLMLSKGIGGWMAAPYKKITRE